MNHADQHVCLVCRALDTDPRARTRRTLLARDPLAVVDALRIVGRSAGATEGYLCVDAGSDASALASVEAAVRRPGTDDRDLDIHVVPIAPSLVLEDDSALLRVLEGRQAVPHVDVPPAARPLLAGRPAVVQNLETVVRVAPGAPGASIVTVWTEGVVRVVEAGAGATVRDVLRDLAGAGPDADGVKAVRFGGATGRFLAGAGLDTPMGTAETWLPAVLEVVPNGVCGVGAVRDALLQLGAESCGACAVCREGVRQLADLLADVADSRADAELPQLIRELGEALEAGSLCGLGCSAADVLRSGLEVFADDFEAHLQGASCPGGQADA